ncbi:MAG: lipid-A-disaccharide synthase [Burkholderiaceae bacterium]|nr:lipid-A-disaccharide synthase [Burkholderiaceae bacterium]
MSSLAVVAAEASGDLLVAAVLRGMRRTDPELVAAGVGGPAMAEQCFDAWYSTDALSVRGYVEVLRAYPRLLAMRNAIRKRVIEWRPALFLGVDAPDFNLGLERRLREAGIAVAHFVGPSVWAWRADRIARIRAAVDHMLLVFPFEEKLYRDAGIPATYVGHPLADLIPLQVDRPGARAALALESADATIALLPGSRPSEVEYMGALFLETAAWMQRARPGLQFVLPAAGQSLYARLRDLAARTQPQLRLTIVQGRSHLALAAADAVLVASGTATLEAALMRRPMVIAYRMAWLSHRIMRRQALIPWIGLPNILCSESLVPEFVQDEARPQAMGAALLNQLDDDVSRARIERRFGQIHAELRRDCATRASEVLLGMMAKARGANA